MASLVEGNVLADLQLQDRSFHLVTSLNLIQEIPAISINPLLAEVRRILNPDGVFRAVVLCMADDGPPYSVFRELAIRDGATDFDYADDLWRILEDVKGFSQVQIRVASSPAAAAASQARTRFELFTGIMAEVKTMGLQSEERRQRVGYFSAERPA